MTNTPSGPLVPLSRKVVESIALIKAERALALKEFASFANRAVRIGEMLTRLKASIDHGQWAAALLEIGIADRTASRWIAHYKERIKYKPDQDGFVLNDLQSTADLMRFEEQVKPCHGAKTTSEDYNRRKRDELTQQDFNFLYDDHFMPFAGRLLRARCIEDYEVTTLRQMRKHLAAIDARLAEIEERKAQKELQP